MRDQNSQLSTPANSELGVDVSEMKLHCLHTEEELGSHLPIGQSAGDGKGDLQLLRRQLGQSGAH
jgi:hypothetical protein